MFLKDLEKLLENMKMFDLSIILKPMYRKNFPLFQKEENREDSSPRFAPFGMTFSLSPRALARELLLRQGRLLDACAPQNNKKIGG